MNNQKFIKTKGLFRSTLETKDRLYLWARVSILPIATLLPFMVFSDGWVDCSANPEISDYGPQCLTYTEPTLAWPFWLGLGLVILVSLIRISKKSVEELKKFVYMQLILSVLTAIFTTLVYLTMYANSQGKYIFSVAGPPIGGMEGVIFGVGIERWIFTVIVFVYLLVPILRWYKIIFSKNYFFGIKKKELFQ